jgi:tetratricopeptide (TPR) repeat protein
MYSEKGKDTRTLEHLRSYADYQFGQPIAGSDYRERVDGQRIGNWVVDICILLEISSKMADVYVTNLSLSTMIRNDKMYPHLERSLHILSPWMVTINSDAIDQSNSLDVVQINHLLEESFRTERSLAVVAMDRAHFDVAEGHCHRCLVNSRKLSVEGENKTSLIFEALCTYVELRRRQQNYESAVTFAEDAYNLVVTAYNPVHRQVQEAAGRLIDCLTSKGDLFNAGRYAEITYSNLRDHKNGMNQEGEEVGEGAYNWANVIYLSNGDLTKAEVLAREALNIRERFHGPYHSNVGRSCILLATILQKQDELGDQTKKLFERSIAIFIRDVGLDGANTAGAYVTIGQFYIKVARIQSTVDLKRKQLLLAKSYVERGLQIYFQRYGSAHPNTINSVTQLAMISNELSKI